jgi:hypothetical protein
MLLRFFKWGSIFLFLIEFCEAKFSLGEPLRELRSLASGYPLHHPLRASHAGGVRTRGAHKPRPYGWFRYYPSRFRTFGAISSNSYIAFAARCDAPTSPNF